MTIQKAAHQLLREVGKPVSSKELARMALERRVVSSTAQDPIQSHAQTIEKNIRDGVYNNPQLVFVQTDQGRLIGLPEWGAEAKGSPVRKEANGHREIKVRIPLDILEKIQLAEQAKLADTFDDTVVFLLNKGLTSASSEIKSALMKRLNQLDTL